MNNQADKTEKFEPKDSEQKKTNQPQEIKAVVNPEDEIYKKEDADFKNPAKTRENSEQPIHPGKEKKVGME